TTDLYTLSLHDALPILHLVVEATKQAFAIRDKYVCDPAYMEIDPQDCLTDTFLEKYVAEISLDKALPWGKSKGPADTIWMGVIRSEEHTSELQSRENLV